MGRFSLFCSRLASTSRKRGLHHLGQRRRRRRVGVQSLSQHKTWTTAISPFSSLQYHPFTWTFCTSPFVPTPRLLHRPLSPSTNRFWGSSGIAFQGSRSRLAFVDRRTPLLATAAHTHIHHSPQQSIPLVLETPRDKRRVGV